MLNAELLGQQALTVPRDPSVQVPYRVGDTGGAAIRKFESKEVRRDSEGKDRG